MYLYNILFFEIYTYIMSTSIHPYTFLNFYLASIAHRRTKDDPISRIITISFIFQLRLYTIKYE